MAPFPLVPRQGKARPEETLTDPEETHPVPMEERCNEKEEEEEDKDKEDKDEEEEEEYEEDEEEKSQPLTTWPQLPRAVERLPLEEGMEPSTSLQPSPQRQPAFSESLAESATEDDEAPTGSLPLKWNPFATLSGEAPSPAGTPMRT